MSMSYIKLTTTRHIVSGSADCKVRLWKITDGVWKKGLVMRGHKSGVVDVAFAADGR